MLPDGFRWTPRCQYANGELALVLDWVEVAALMQALDGRWSAYLDRHHPITAPLVTRRCQSLETGRDGVETWAARHEARLRAEVARVPRPRHWG